MLAAGTYMAEVTAHGISKNEGHTPQLFIVFRAEESGSEMTWYSNMGYSSKGFSQKAYDYCVNQLAGLKWDPAENDFEFHRLGMGTELVGRKARIVVKDDTYNGNTRQKIAFINDPDRGGAPEAIDPRTEGDFFKQLRANAYKAEAGRGAREAERRAAPKASKPSESQGHYGGSEYDEIPF